MLVYKHISKCHLTELLMIIEGISIIKKSFISYILIFIMENYLIIDLRVNYKHSLDM